MQIYIAYALWLSVVLLDLSVDAIPCSEIGREIDRLYHQHQTEFINFIELMAININQNRIDWLLSGPASRNPTLSQLHHHYILLLLCKALIDNKCLTEVIVDSNAVFEIVSNLIQQANYSCVIRHKHGLLRRTVRQLRSTLSPFRTMVSLTWSWLVTKLICIKTKGPVPNKLGLILIDQFVIPQSVLNDRYYPGLFEAMEANIKPRVYFVPHFHGFTHKKRISALNLYKKNNQQVVFKEKYISCRNLFWCFAHWYRIRQLPVDDIVYHGINFKALILEDLKGSRSFRCAVEGLQNYVFAETIVASKLKISRTIDWFENHPLDRGWNAGFSQNKKEICVVGYEGYYPAQANQRSTQHESQEKLGIIPQIIFTMSDGFRVDIQQFDETVKVQEGPAFRYAQMHNVKPSIKDQKPFSLIVALPYDEKTCWFILGLLVKLADNKYAIQLKSHPASNIDSEVKEFVGKHDNIMITQDALIDCYPNANVLMTGGAATTILEAMAYGLAVIVVEQPGKRHNVSIPADVDSKMWAYCDNFKDMGLQITTFNQQFANESNYFEQQSELMRNKHFKPLKNDDIHRMLGA